MSYIEINDIFDEMRDKNNRRFNELMSAKNLINIYSEFKSFIESTINTFNIDSNALNKYQELCLKIELKRKTHKIITGSDDSDKSLTDTKTIDTKKVRPKRVYTKRVRSKSQFLCPFDGCDNRYNTRNQLQEHTQTEHLPIVPEYEADSEWDETNQRSDDSVGENVKKRVDPKIVDTKKVRTIPQIICPFDGCDNKYQTRLELKKHSLSQHLPTVPKSEDDSDCDDPNESSKQKNHTCNYTGCQYKTDKVRFLRQHISKHIRTKVWTHFCRNCKTGFNTGREWRSHMKSAHDIDRPYVCPHIGCEASFKKSWKFREHKMNHKEELSLVCAEPECGEKFANRDHFTKHVLYVHSQPDRMKCEWPGCEFNTGDPRHMNKHKRTHTQERPFVCDVDQCGKAFMHRDPLYRHKQEVHRLGTIYKCFWPGCEYSTAALKSIRTHESVHKTGGGEYVCSWPECGKRMAYKKSLEDHINAIHKNVKPFSCRVAGCQYRTAFHRNIPQHMKTHRNKGSKKSIPNDSRSDPEMPQCTNEK